LSEKTIKVEVAGAKEELERMKKDMEEVKRKHAEEKAKLEADVAKGKADAKEKEKLQKTLKDLADKEFDEKKQELLNRVEKDKENLGEERYDDLVEKINSEEFTPVKLDATMQMLDFLNDALTAAKEKYETAQSTETKTGKTKKTPAGKVTIKTKTGGDEENIFTREYADNEGRQFAEDLYAAWRNETDPQKKAELNEAINNVWRKIWRAEVDAVRSGSSSIPDSKLVLDKATANFLKEKRKMREA